MADNKYSDKEMSGRGLASQEEVKTNLSSSNPSNPDPSNADRSNLDTPISGEFGQDYSIRTLTVGSLVIISALLLLGTMVGNLLNVSRVDSQLDTRLASHRLWIMDVLMTVSDSAYDVSKLDEICKAIELEGQQGKEFDSAILVSKKLTCDLMPNRESHIDIYFISTTAGYSGEIALIVGLEMGTVLSYLRVLNHHETTGFGEKLLHLNSAWMKSLLNRPQQFFIEPRTIDELDAISGATITANAVSEMILHSFVLKQNTSEVHE